MAAIQRAGLRTFLRTMAAIVQKLVEAPASADPAAKPATYPAAASSAAAPAAVAAKAELGQLAKGQASAPAHIPRRRRLSLIFKLDWHILFLRSLQLAECEKL